MKETFHNSWAVLRCRRASLVLLASVLSVIGDAAAQVGLLLRVHANHGSSATLAVMLVIFALPFILFSGVAGRLADLPDVRVVTAAATVLQTTAALGLAWRTDLVSSAIGAFVLQTGFALAGSAWLVASTRLVPDDQVGAFVSLCNSSFALAAPIGAAVSGLLVENVGLAAPFLLDAVSFLPLLFAALLLPVRAGEEGTPTPPSPSGLLSLIVPLDGVAALRRQPLLAILIWATMPFIIALEAVNAVEVFLVKDQIGGTSAEYGLAESAAGAAVVVGALCAGAAQTTRSRVFGTFIGMGAVSTVQITQGFAPTMPIYMALAAAVGFGMGLINAFFMTLMVTEIEADLRGRALAFVTGATRACGLLALALGGGLGSLLGPRGTFVVVGTLGLLICLVATPVVHRRYAALVRSGEPSAARC